MKITSLILIVFILVLNAFINFCCLFALEKSELIDEVILLPIPVSAATIRSHLATSKLGHLLNEMNRDDERPVLDQIVDIALTLQRLTIKFDDKIEAIDINPVIVGSGRCLAVDAMIILKTEK